MADVLHSKAKITEETLRASARRHNGFPPDTAFPQIDSLSGEVQELCSIIARYHAQNIFRLRLLHRHIMIPEGQIMLGTSMRSPTGFWTRPTPIIDVDLDDIHPHIISVDSDCITNESEGNMLLPSEFREGPPANLGNIESDFYRDFANCILRRGLQEVFGLEIVQDQVGKMVEFSFDIGSLLLEDKQVKEDVKEQTNGLFQLQETSWRVTVKDGVVCKTGETRCVTYTTGHIKFTDSKAKSLLDVMRVLRDEGALVT